MKWISLLIMLLLPAALSSLQAQTTCPPFWKEIEAFKKADSAKMPSQKAILFIGSSSFTLWKDVQDYFPGYAIINRGFGGSQLTDVIRYAYDVILPYSPKQVLIYCGENDIAANVKAKEVVLRLKTLFGIIRQNLPETSIYFVSMKPSPAREQFAHKVRSANAAIRSFLQKQKRSGYINVYHAMLNEKGLPRPELFLEDRLHMNAEGYRIWQKNIQPYLAK
jgi:lysophospholipase L1-like esterase